MVPGILCFSYGLQQAQLSWELFYYSILGLLAISASLALFSTNSYYLTHTFRIFLGLVFIYSGFVKAVDPPGSQYKFIDYFEAWNIMFAEPAALPLSILLSLSEFIIGIALFFNLLTRYASLGALIFMIGFTPITLYLALQEQSTGKELVHDCGCFGDALILTNWQTFWKNIVLLIPAIWVFIRRNRFISNFNQTAQSIIIAGFALMSLIISYIGIEHLPIIDFRPYKIGTNIPKSMEIPEGAPQPEYKTLLYYKNTVSGEIKEFSLENYPNDTVWQFADVKNILVKEGYAPPIQNFSITSKEEGDITDMILQDTNYNFLLIAYDLQKSSVKKQKEINELYQWAKSKQYNFRCVTSSIDEIISTFKKQHNAQY
ncbi:MAG: BT_3928 family protein, partial [Endomicrobiia bacterium]